MYFYNLRPYSYQGTFLSRFMSQNILESLFIANHDDVLDIF